MSYTTNTNQSPLSNRSSEMGRGKWVVLVGFRVRVQPARSVYVVQKFT